MLDLQDGFIINSQGKPLNSVEDHFIPIPQQPEHDPSPRNSEDVYGDIRRKVRLVVKKIKTEAYDKNLPKPNTLSKPPSPWGIDRITLTINTIEALVRKKLKNYSKSELKNIPPHRLRKHPRRWRILKKHFKTNKKVTQYIRGKALNSILLGY